MTVRTINIDFAPKSWTRSFKKLKPVMSILGCIGLILCSITTWQSIIVLKNDALREITLKDVQEKLAAFEKKQKIERPEAISKSQATAVNVVISKLNLPWLNILDSIEAATPREIALLSLEPDVKKTMLRGVAEAKTTDEMIAYIQALGEQKFFSFVTLTRHEINNLDVNKPIRFQFEASWIERIQ